MCLESLSKILFPQICHTFESWCVLSFCVLKGNISFFKKSIMFFACSLKEVQNFFIQSFLRYKVCLFSLWSNGPNCWDWISTRNMLTYFCCWRIFWIICTSIYFSNERFNITINNLVHFTWLHLLFKF